MLHEIVNLKEKFPALKNDVNLFTYAQDNSPEISPNRTRPAIIICPGGGYAFTSDREAEPLALSFMARGYQAFVLRYSVAPSMYPTALLEVAAAFAYVRNEADKYHVATDEISVLGFSAGGHLSASFGTLWNDAMLSETLGVSTDMLKPNALILSYPVISSGEFAHVGSFDNLTGEDVALREYLSLEKRVGAHVPPTFLWHTWSDTLVPVENSLLFATALRKNNVPFEMHIFPYGPHGLSLANEQCISPDANCINEHVAVWFDLCDKWLRTMFSIRD